MAELAEETAGPPVSDDRSIAIVEAVADDEAELVALWNASGLTRPWNDPAADFRRALSWPGSTILVVRDEGGIAGSAMVGYDGHRGWVYYLAVAERRRRCGLGRWLMDAAQAWLVARGAPKVQLMVRDDNHEAVAFHRALGLETQKVATLGRFLGDD
ncbi:MAG: family acetyltransferase [Alphaproteobacteria bacterium]|nr:family acetyltransferase [Alphaproteobacteria bacterium]